MRNLLSAKKAELENMLLESEAALEQEEEQVHNLNTEKAKLQLNITNLEEQWVLLVYVLHTVICVCTYYVCMRMCVCVCLCEAG